MIPIEVLKAAKAMQERENFIQNQKYLNDVIPEELQAFVNWIRFGKESLVNVYGNELLSELRDKWYEL